MKNYLLRTLLSLAVTILLVSCQSDGIKLMPEETIANNQEALFVKDLDGNPILQIEPKLLAQIHFDLLRKGKNAELQKLKSTYDASGKAILPIPTGKEKSARTQSSFTINATAKFSNTGWLSFSSGSAVTMQSGSNAALQAFSIGISSLPTGAPGLEFKSQIYQVGSGFSSVIDLPSIVGSGTSSITDVKFWLIAPPNYGVAYSANYPDVDLASGANGTWIFDYWRGMVGGPPSSDGFPISSLTVLVYML